MWVFRGGRSDCWEKKSQLDCNILGNTCRQIVIKFVYVTPNRDSTWEDPSYNTKINSNINLATLNKL